MATATTGKTEITTGKILHDADRGRIALSYGNPVICMDWVERIVEEYGDHIENITDDLTMYEESPKGTMKNPLADVSVLVAKLERLSGSMGE